MASITDCITSFIDGRVRLRHPALRNAATADMAASMVSGVDGVESVQVNPRTGSLLIFYDAEKLSREKLLELAKQGAALLPEEKKQEALRAVKRLRPAEDLYLKRNRTGELAFENKFFRLELNPETASADTIYLKANRFRFKNSGLFMYETFDRNDYERFRHQYLRLPDAEWAIRDFTKPDLPAKTKKQQFEGFQSDVYKTLWGHGCRITFATEKHPGFRRIEIDYILPDEEDYLEIRLKWFAKIPNRLPHAAWFSFVPANGGRNCMLKKMEGAGFGRRLPQQHVVIIPIHRRFCTWGRRIPSVREHVHDEIAS